MTDIADLYAVYGASGYGREVMPVARAQLVKVGVPRNRLVFIDDSPKERIVNGHAVMTYAEFLEVPASKRHAVLAIANSEVRQRLAEECEGAGILPWTVVADNALMLDEVTLGAGSILSPFAMVTSNARIGRHFHANIYSYVAHDCVIGDFVTFAPSVQCNGNVVIEDHAYIGTAAVLKQGQPGAPLVIGKGAVVGMGAVVTKSVAAGITVVGNPARPLQRT
jgi:sugar O-acyltransferase (sialic acid O-acetyltransferase NeuD family)